MLAKTSPALAVAAVLAAGILIAESLEAQTDSAAAMEANLKAQYKPATLKIDNGVLSIVQPGAALVIQEDGILGVSSSESNVPLTIFKVQEGVRQPGVASRTSRLLRAGEKVYVTKIGVDSTNDKVLLTIVECDACNNVQKPSSLLSQVVFELPKGYLQTADASQISDVINEVFLPESAIPSTPPSPAEVPSTAAKPAQKTFSVRHRHISLMGSGSDAIYYCSGELSVAVDGAVRYDCTQTDDPSGRCEHVSFLPGSVKQAKIGYNGALHLASKAQGNADFFGDPGTLQQALRAITSPGEITRASTSGSCDSYESCMQRGDTSLKASESNGALADFRKAAQLDPSKSDPWKAMGVAYLQLGQHEDAVNMWDKALQSGATLSIPVCHAGFACGDTGDFLLNMKEVSFVNKKSEKEFAVGPSAVSSQGATLFRNNAYYWELKVAGKNYRFYYEPISIQCGSNVFCPEPGRTQQRVVADYVHNTLDKLRAGSFGSSPGKP